MVLVEIRQKIALTNRRIIASSDVLKVIRWIAVFVMGTGSLIGVQLGKCLLKDIELLRSELFEIVSNESEQFVSSVEPLHDSLHSRMIICHALRRHSPIVHKFMEEMPDVSINSSVFMAVGVADCRPIELQQTLALTLKDISVIDSLNSLYFKAEKVLDGCL